MNSSVAWVFAPLDSGPLGVAVSGGGDSLALLDVLSEVTKRHGVSLEAATVDHGLRPEAAQEADAVGAFCATRAIPHEILTWSGPTGGNLQADARDARYALLADWAGRRGIARVALGHTQDDVAETMLMRLARVSGVDGLAAMAAQFERNGITWVRPFLGVSRAECRTRLESRGVTWSDDPTNDDPRFDRSRARAILATLEPLGITRDGLAQSAEALAAARAALEHYTAVEARRLVRQDAGDLVVERAGLAALPQEMRRRLLVAALRWISGAGYAPRQSALDALETALAGGQDTHTLAGCVVTATRESLRVGREPAAVATHETATTEAWDGRWALAGPHADDLTIRALGDGVTDCPDWRASGLPRQTLLASPSVWRGGTLVAAPLAGFANGWSARLLPGRDDFFSHGISH